MTTSSAWNSPYWNRVARIGWASTANPTAAGKVITTATDTVVTLKELMYPGWQVAVDGVAVEAAATSDVFRSVQVPAGSHTVQWNFRPVSLTIGMWGSMLFVLISGGVAVVVQRRVATTRGRGTDSTPVVGESPPPGNPPSSRTTT